MSEDITIEAVETESVRSSDGGDRGEIDATAAVDSDVENHYEQAVQVEWTPMPQVPHTGDPRVDDAGSRLADLDGLDLHEHADVFQDVHDRLRAVLADDASANR